MKNTLDAYVAKTGAQSARLLPDGRVAFLYRLLYTWSICVGAIDNTFGYDDRWCCHTELDALSALAAWDGVGEPTGWHRHPASGRRRPGGDPTQEYIEP